MSLGIQTLTLCLFLSCGWAYCFASRMSKSDGVASLRLGYEEADTSISCSSPFFLLPCPCQCPHLGEYDAILKVAVHQRSPPETDISELVWTWDPTVIWVEFEVDCFSIGALRRWQPYWHLGCVAPKHLRDSVETLVLLYLDSWLKESMTYRHTYQGC